MSIKIASKSVSIKCFKGSIIKINVLLKIMLKSKNYKICVFAFCSSSIEVSATSEDSSSMSSSDDDDSSIYPWPANMLQLSDSAYVNSSDVDLSDPTYELPPG